MQSDAHMKLVLSGLLCAALWFPSASAEGQPASLEQARKEGEVILYSTITVSAFNELNKAIKEKYPFLNVRHIRLGPAQQLARIMQEQRADHVIADVIYNNLLHLIYLKESGILGRYESTESKFLMKEAIDSDGFWVGGDIDVLVTGFNTNMIARKDVPTTYDGFLDGKLKGQMAINSNNPYALVGMASLRGEEQGIAYMRKLAQQNLRPVQGFTHMANLLAAGEYPTALFSQVTKIEEMKEKGAPVDWVSNSPNFSTVGAYGLSRNPPHPAGARLLVDFVLSDQGQKILGRTGKLPMRRGVPTQSKSIDKLLESGNLHPIKDAKGFEKYAKIYRELIERR
ncbi:MAG: ABC transporter substrate-binding protein [Candidatus Binatia bacterium]